MPGKKDARASGKPYIFSFLYFFSEHIACQPTTIKKSDLNSINYRINDLMDIICNPGKIEKFRIQYLNFSNFAPNQKYFLEN